MCFFVIKVQYTPGCYMEVVILQFVWNNICPSMEWYAQPNYMKVYLLLLQIVSKYIFLIECMEVFIVEWLLWYVQPNYMEVYLLLLQIVSKYIFLI